jgi:PPOX class probable F420-dependent enzyme
MGFTAFAEQKYLNLETFKKSGDGVKTPVWFAADPRTPLDSGDAKLYAYTMGVSGKVKRIRNNPRVRIAPCDMRGNLLGEWVEAQAEIITGDQSKYADSLLNKKYMPWKQILNFFAKLGGKGRNCFAIRPAN